MYYPYSVVINKTTYTLLWFTDETSKKDLLLKKNKQLVVGTNKEDLEICITNEDSSIDWSQPSTETDIDLLFNTIETMSKTHSSTSEQNNLLLDAWNLFEDLMRTFDMNEMYSENRTALLDTVYDKLFWGIDTFSAMSTNPEFSPVWNDQEISSLKDFMSSASKVFTPKIIGSTNKEAEDKI